MEKNQSRTPIYQALLRHHSDRIVPFDVPGHKGGRGTPELTEFLGERCLRLDVNSSKPLDNLCSPVSIIKESEELAADCFGAENVFLMVNGTTSAVQAMIMSVCKPGDKIIMPRNVHRSAINALVICGAVPVYINPCVNKTLGISLGMTVADAEDAMQKHPDAKAILVNNPTYYGICSDLEGIVRVAHKRGIKVLVDEAHGTHFYFGENMPKSGMAAGADMSAVSMHKTGGSLTQSSFLLLSASVDASYVRQIVNLTQTTSASYLLMSSLDLARKNLALNGKAIFKRIVELADYSRKEIRKIGGYWAFSSDIIDKGAVFDFDPTKLSVHTRAIGLAGIEVYDILREDYDIQIEFGDLGNILAILSAGDRLLEIERLIAALSEIKRENVCDPKELLDSEYIEPDVCMSPQDAFYGLKKSVMLNDAVGCVSGEFVMCYPPGIPILAPGERITPSILEYITFAKEKGCRIIGTQDEKTESIYVLKK